jgi:hypothetical protein
VLMGLASDGLAWTYEGGNFRLAVLHGCECAVSCVNGFGAGSLGLRFGVPAGCSSSTGMKCHVYGQD